MAIALGRLGKIIDHVLVLANLENEISRPDAPITEAKLIVWCNQCQCDVATGVFWQKTTTMSTAASTPSYALETVIPRYNRVDHVWWNYAGSKYQLAPFASRKEYDYALSTGASEGKPAFFLVENGYLYLWYIPDAVYANAVEIHHSFVPTELDGTTNYTPFWPVNYDLMAEYYCMWMLSLKDATSRHLPALAVQYETLYKKKRAQLIDTQMQPRVAMRPPR